ncbi:hypothetical protein RIF29_08218 [Crotalaria pallida]|uniref:Uncharacterized protein n=1 Tax=Crotalaria pallida TaxID=3830 RepID=A0AAN9J6V2_CROPI
MLRNPSFPQPNILSADELFLDGVLLPLHLLPTTRLTLKPDPEQLSPPPPPHQQHPEPPTPSSASITASSAAVLSSSKRWKDIFRKSDKKKNSEEEEEKVDEGKKKKKKERKGAGTSSAELNINIWPFSRSRSAGNSGSTRPKVFPSTRKVNSAPCSRSNSGGESKSRKWGSSPGRAGIHLGRSSPVWRGTRKGKGNVMNMNVPVPPMRRRCDDNNTIAGGGSSNNISGEQGVFMGTWIRELGKAEYIPNPYRLINYYQ